MWLQPKIDWYGNTTNGVYVGDTFDANDYNRIKNNIEHLSELANILYKEFDITNLTSKTYSDYFYADEINVMTENLDRINEKTLKLSYEKLPSYKYNDKMMTYKELNTLEKSILDLYEILTNQINGRRKCKFMLGTGVDI